MRVVYQLYAQQTGSELRNDDLLTLGRGPQGLKLHTQKFGYSPSMWCLYQISEKLGNLIQHKSLSFTRV